MQAEHFILGLFTNAGSIRPVLSSKVEKWLTEESIKYLYNLGERIQPQNGNPIISNFPTEQIIAYTYLGQTQGIDGRTHVWNHTILLRHSDLFLAAKPKVESHFIKAMENPPRKLEPIEIG